MFAQMARLKVDFDGALPRELVGRIGHVVSCAGSRVLWWSVYRTRRGWHLEIDVTRRWSPMRIVAAQAMLGSDPKREAFNMARVMGLRGADSATRTRWNVLYTRKINVRITDTEG